MVYEIGLASNTLCALKQMGIGGMNLIKDTIYPIYVKQALISGFCSLLVCLVVLIAGIVIIKIGNNLAKQHLKNDISYEVGEDGDEVIFFYVCAGLILAIVMVYVVFNAGTIFSSILNPQYSAIQNLLATCGNK